MGRPTWRSSGVPLGGAADVLSHRVANVLVGNDDGAATLELAGGRWKAQVEQGGWAAHFGTGGTLLVDGAEVAPGRTLFLPTGANLHVRATAEGNFSYLATAGGWSVPKVLGSRSTCLAAGFGGLDGKPLQAGDTLRSDREGTSNVKPETSNFRLEGQFWQSRWYAALPPRADKNIIRILPGPEQGWWSATQQRLFLEKPFPITLQRDRMGIRLLSDNGCDLRLSGDVASAMRSTAVAPGTIQVPPDGCPIVLLADAQTTGGYPRIGQVAAADLPVLAQVPTGQGVCFQQVSEEDAERLLEQQERWLQRLRLGWRWYKMTAPASCSVPLR